jgi:hypothetical protein
MRNASEAEPVPPNHSRSSSKTVFDPCRNPPKSTKTPFKIHTCRCRVRRKRERLTSNGSIESDAAVSVAHTPGVRALEWTPFLKQPVNP